MATADDTDTMILLARRIGAALESEPDRESRFAALCIHIAQHIAQIREEERGQCFSDAMDLIAKYALRFVREGAADRRWGADA